jgi:hypothetical protein
VHSFNPHFNLLVLPADCLYLYQRQPSCDSQVQLLYCCISEEHVSVILEVKYLLYLTNGVIEL